MFFRQWRRSQEQADFVADAVRRAASRIDAYEPLTKGVAGAFPLASAALFEQAEDGGFVRVAAHGWPGGTTWHILPNDSLATRASEGRRILDIDALHLRETDLPAGVADPKSPYQSFLARRCPRYSCMESTKMARALTRTRSGQSASSRRTQLWDTVSQLHH